MNGHEGTKGNKGVEKNHKNTLYEIPYPRRQCAYAIITSSLRQNDVTTSFWRNNDVIITSSVHSVVELCRIPSGIDSLRNVDGDYVEIGRNDPILAVYYTTIVNIP